LVLRHTANQGKNERLAVCRLGHPVSRAFISAGFLSTTAGVAINHAAGIFQRVHSIQQRHRENQLEHSVQLDVSPSRRFVHCLQRLPKHIRNHSF